MSDCDKGIFKEHCEGRFDKLDNSIADLNRSLFQGNGKPSIVTQIDRNTQFIKRIYIWAGGIWAITLIAVACILRKILN